MRRWFTLFLVTVISLFFWPALAGCAQGKAEEPPRPLRMSPASAVDLGTRVPGASDTPGALDAGARILDAGSRTPIARDAGGTSIANPAETRVCDDSMTRLHLEQNPASLGPCAAGWTLILWGAGGASEPYLSTPGASLDVTIRADWLGWAAFTAYCGDWSGVRHWESFESRPSSDAGVSVTLNGNPVPVQVCYDPGDDLIRPLIPVQCGLPACPGPSY